MIKLFLLFSAVNGALAVILGAFGAHALKAKISPALFTAYQTASQYHFIHVLALLALSILLLQLSDTPKTLMASGYLWIVGIILFSGSLYGLALGAPSWFGPITPMGGLLLIVGWLCFAVGIAESSM